MKHFLKKIRYWKENIRNSIIHKLGGFSIMPPYENRVIISSTNVTPRKYTYKVLFDQEELYDITPADLERAAKEKLRSKLINEISNSDMVYFSSSQDDITGTIEMRACIWVVDPKAMKGNE